MTFDELLKSKRYPLYDERERHRHSEYGRKPQRIVRHCAGREVYTPQLCHVVPHADLQGACRKSEHKPQKERHGHGNLKTKSLFYPR